MTRLPSMSTRDVIRALQRGGFVVRRNSDHVVLKRDHCTVSVPQYQHEMKLSTLRRILRYAGVSVDEFQQWHRCKPREGGQMNEKGGKHRAAWTEDDDAFIHSHVHLSAAELAVTLQRTVDAVRQRCRRIGRQREWGTQCKVCGAERYYGVSSLLCKEHYLEYMRGIMQQRRQRKGDGHG